MTSEEQSHGIGRLRHGLWSLALRSRLRKGNRIARPPTPPPTCEERVHYPIFNPRDPRHNPSAVSFSGFKLSEGSSHLQSMEHKTHSLPRRSLRRARSGLLAIRPWIHRRPREQNQRHSIPGVWRPSGLDESSSDHQAECFPSTVSEASTENERGFGVNLYRTRCSGLPTRRRAYAEPDEYENAFPHGSTSGIPEVDIGPAGLRLDGDTLHELSEPEENEETLGSEATRQQSRGMTIAWDDGHLNRFPSSHATSDYIGSGTTSTSSEESTNSQVISDANQALEALCLLVPPTGDSCSNSDVEPGVGIDRAVQEDIPSPDSPTLPSEMPVERHLDESNAEHSTTGDNDQLEQAKPTERTEQVSQVEEDKEAEKAKEAEEIGQAEQTHQASEVEEPEGELEEVPAENANDTKAMPDATILNDISANSLKALESIADSSSGQYTQSRYSASLSEGNSNTPPISLCIDSPNPLYYDDLISLPSLNLGDEYFYADGKTTTHNPDQDRTPIKSENVLIRNGSIDSGFSSGFSSSFNIERSISVSTRGHAPPLLGPGSVVQQPPACQPRLHNNRLRRSGGTSDSEDCYFTYSMFQQRYGS